MRPVLLGEVKAVAKTADIIGIDDDTEIVRYIDRALKALAFKANWDLYLATIDLCVGCNGCVTLPSDVGVPLAVNIGGSPTVFRNSWYEYNINGTGSCGPGCAWNWSYPITDDRGWTPAFQQLTAFSYLSAITENAQDGDGTKFLTVWGITVDSSYNEKEVSFQVPMVYGQPYPNMDYQIKRVTRVIKPVTTGYVKLIGFTGVDGDEAKTIGYYAPHETQPRYRQIKVSQGCTWVRVKYRRNDMPLVNDTDIVPVPHLEAIITMMKSIRFSERNDAANAEMYEQRATRQLVEYQASVNPQAIVPQFDPTFGIGTIDWR